MAWYWIAGGVVLALFAVTFAYALGQGMCKHNWALLSQTYQEAPNRLSHIGGMKWVTVEEALAVRKQTMEIDLYAKTSYLFQCERCKELRTEVLFGKEVST